MNDLKRSKLIEAKKALDLANHSVDNAKSSMNEARRGGCLRISSVSLTRKQKRHVASLVLAFAEFNQRIAKAKFEEM